MGMIESNIPAMRRCVTGALGIKPLRLPFMQIVAVDTVLAILSLFLLKALFAFLTLLATVGHDTSFTYCTPSRFPQTRRTSARHWRQPVFRAGAAGPSRRYSGRPFRSRA